MTALIELTLMKLRVLEKLSKHRNGTMEATAPAAAPYAAPCRKNSQGGQGEKTVIFHPGFVLLERLAEALHHLPAALPFQHILPVVGLMLVSYQTGGKDAMGGFMPA